MKLSNLLDIKTMVDEIEKTSSQRLAESLTIPVNKVLPVVLANTEVKPVVHSANEGMEVEDVSNVALDKEVRGKGFTVDSRYCPNKGDVQVVARKTKIVCHDEPIVVDAPTDVDVDKSVADTVSETKSIVKGSGNIGLESGTPVF